MAASGSPRLRRDVESHLRCPAHAIDRRDRGRALRPEHYLCRQRRRFAAARSFGRRRHLQIHRRGKTWTHLGLRDGSRFRRWRSIRAIRTAFSRPCSAIPTGPTRSAAFFARPTAGRPGKKFFTRTRTPAARTSPSIPRNPEIVYASLWEARAGPVGGRQRVQRHEQRPFQIHRWRRHLDTADDGLPEDCCKCYVADRASDPSRLYATVANGRGHGGIYRSDDGGDTGRRSRPIRGRRGASAAAILPSESGSEESRRRLHRQHRHLALDRRRQNLDGFRGRARRRRLSEHLDQSDESRTLFCWSAIRARWSA